MSFHCISASWIAAAMVGSTGRLKSTPRISAPIVGPRGMISMLSLVTGPGCRLAVSNMGSSLGRGFLEHATSVAFYRKAVLFRPGGPLPYRELSMKRERWLRAACCRRQIRARTDDCRGDRQKVKGHARSIEGEES